MFFDWTSTVRFVCLSACLFYVPVRVYVCLWHVSIENNKSQQLCKHNDILFEVEQPYKQCIDLNYSSNYELVIQKKLICNLDLIWNIDKRNALCMVPFHVWLEMVSKSMYHYYKWELLGNFTIDNRKQVGSTVQESLH